jgi:hypothetical protein
MAGRIAYYGNIVRDGLVLDLDAAKRDSYPGSGTSWRDIAGGVITGSLINGPTFDTNNGGSIVFDGVNDYVDCEVISPLPSGTQNRTIQVWVNYSLEFVPPILTAISGYGVNGTGQLFQLSVGGTTFSNDKLFLWGSSNNYVSTFSLDREIWTNVAVTVTTGITFPRITIYKNGISDNGAEVNINTRSTNNYSIGNNVGFGSRFKGKISQNLVYNRALSAAEILQNYNATKGRYGL